MQQPEPVPVAKTDADRLLDVAERHMLKCVMSKRRKRREHLQQRVCREAGQTRSPRQRGRGM